jgi:predicted permease
MLGRKSPLNDLDADIRDHIERETQDNISRGMTPADARFAALRKFGNITLTQEATRHIWISVWFDQLVQDLRFAFRTLRKFPGFTVAAVLTLTLGIGVNTSIFSLLYSLVLRPLPVKDPASIVSIYQQFRGHYSRGVYGAPSLLSYPEYVNFRDSARAFSGLAAFADDQLSLSGATGQTIPALLASCNYFDVLAAEIIRGRGFSPDDCRASGAGSVAVISNSFWSAHFGSDPAAIGKTLTLNRHAFTIVGITAKDFGGTELQVPDAWIPLSMAAQLLPNEFKNPDWLVLPNVSWLNVVGRLQPGVSHRAAQSELAILANRADEQYAGRQTIVSVNSGAYFNSPEIRVQGSAVAVAIFALASFVLAIACVNVMNLLLSRAESRRQEISVRLALGASRARLLRQLLTEIILFTALGGVASVLVVQWLPPLLVHAVPETPDIPHLNLSPNLAILAYSFLVTLVAAVVCGLAPALRSTRSPVTSSSREISSALTRAPARARLRSSLIVAQVAGSAALLVSAALLARGLNRAETAGPGFATHNVFLVSLDLANNGYNDTRADALVRQFCDRLAAMPGVEGVASSAAIPGVIAWTTSVSIPATKTDSAAQPVWQNIVSASYFQTMGVHLLRGRVFTEQEANSSGAAPAIISNAMARTFWPEADPLQKTFRSGTKTFQVFGIAPDAQNVHLGQLDGAFFYAPASPEAVLESRIVVRTTGDPATLEAAIPQLAHQFDANLIATTETLEQELQKTLAPAKTLGSLIGVLGILAMLLAIVGVWGLVAYAACRRTREIGIRKALGATPQNILTLLLSEAAALTAIGLAVGLGIGAGASQLLSAAGLLFGVSSLDPLAYLAIAATFALVSLLACYLPARRAMRLDPMIALRHE